ncbi:hypothetical protein DPEC_G00152650 [Dallia pectoralis]|uniref:Uncharacterized protein n=1 Tax=Dallia pectoralis TaxID=75939 RepID=A0ACC2GJY1_DALPE|nr:hypothetical protein DPEC_G00152650 [Dallia pectoralis]
MLSPLLIPFLVEAILCTVLGEMLYKKAGGDLVFTPNMSNIAGPITGIVWKQVKDKELTNKVVDWDESLGLSFYGTFKGRTTLDRVTGVLSIKDVSKKDNGEYLMEINSKFVTKYTLSVINVVPTPQITYSCAPDKTTCTLTCEGNTTDAEPVTYSWIKGEVALETSAKQLNVTKTEGSETNYKCNLTNPVSEKFSRVFEGDLFGNNPGEMLYEKAGGDLVFTPKMSDIADPITRIVWKQVKDKGLTSKVVDWEENLGLSVYGTFKGRATLDRVTGVLSIKDLSEKDNGEYLMEINSKFVTKFTLSVINGWWTKSRMFGLSIFVVATLLVLLFTIVHRFKTGVWFYQKESMPWEGEFWKKRKEAGPLDDASNGVSYSAVNDPSPNEG